MNMFVSVLAVAIAVVVRFVVAELAKTVVFFEGLVGPFNIIMWVTIGLALVDAIVKVLKEVK